MDKYDFYIFDLFEVIAPGLESFVDNNKYYDFLFDYNYEELRRGEISYLDFLELIKVHNDFDINKLVTFYFSQCIPNNDLIELLKKLKINNKKLVLVSDTFKEINDFLLHNYNFFDLFDDIYFSNDYGKTKKSGELFNQIITDGINPKKSIFIDDSNRNIINANKYGFNSYKYESLKLLKKFINENCKNIHFS